ncbi:hypothetical protein TI03_02130 [Achromatium sp. WMS1]|nr:hypothetical protein TI03_02130 [Achromatium sp. WMS1]
MNEGLIIVLSGVVISTLVTTLGIGGGILWTPLFILGFGLLPHKAVTTSFMIQVVGLGSGTIAYLRAGLVQTRLVILLFIAALPGVIIGSVLSVQIPQKFVQMALGMMSLTLAILFVSLASPLSTERQTNLNKELLLKILPIPGFLGFMMGALSVGISEWLLPALRGRLGLTMPEAVATVIPVMFGLATVATLSHGLLSDTNCWYYFAWGAVGTMIGGQLGPRLAQRIDEEFLKDSFIYLMTLVGIHLIFQSI